MKLCEHTRKEDVVFVILPYEEIRATSNEDGIAKRRGELTQADRLHKKKKKKRKKKERKQDG